jgi:prepilin peptidase dependent protein B
MLIRHSLIMKRRSVQRGVGLVELLVGLTVGLFIVAGGLSLLANFTGENRRLLLETRLAQDLRAASDLITRDLRRAGYWNAASSGVWVPGGATVPPQSAYGLFTSAACGAGAPPAAASAPAAATNALCYAIAQDNNNAVAESEKFGFELDGGVIYAVVRGAARVALTDPNTVTITDFVISPSMQVINAANFCSRPCVGNCPKVAVREFEVLLKGQIPGDAGINRFLRSNVRVRNDYYGGQC